MFGLNKRPRAVNKQCDSCDTIKCTLSYTIHGSYTFEESKESHKHYISHRYKLNHNHYDDILKVCPVFKFVLDSKLILRDMYICLSLRYRNIYLDIGCKNPDFILLTNYDAGYKTKNNGQIIESYQDMLLVDPDTNEYVEDHETFMNLFDKNIFNGGLASLALLMKGVSFTDTYQNDDINLWKCILKYFIQNDDSNLKRGKFILTHFDERKNIYPTKTRINYDTIEIPKTLNRSNMLQYVPAYEMKYPKKSSFLFYAKENIKSKSPTKCLYTSTIQSDNFFTAQIILAFFGMNTMILRAKSCVDDSFLYAYHKILYFITVSCKSYYHNIIQNEINYFKVFDKLNCTQDSHSDLLSTTKTDQTIGICPEPFEFVHFFKKNIVKSFLNNNTDKNDANENDKPATYHERVFYNITKTKKQVRELQYVFMGLNSPIREFIISTLVVLKLALESDEKIKANDPHILLYLDIRDNAWKILLHTLRYVLLPVSFITILISNIVYYIDFVKKPKFTETEMRQIEMLTSAHVFDGDEKIKNMMEYFKSDRQTFDYSANITHGYNMFWAIYEDRRKKVEFNDSGELEELVNISQDYNVHLGTFINNQKNVENNDSGELE